jgi:hypothetical protein
VGEGAGDSLQLVRLGARGDAEPVNLAGQHASPEAHPLGATRPITRGVHLDRGAGDRTGRGGERKILRGVIAWIDPHQRDQVAEAPDEIGVEVQARASREGSRGKLTRRPQLRNYGAGGPNRAGRT